MSERPSIPFVADVRATAIFAAAREHGINLSFYDQAGKPIAGSFASVDDVEQFAFDLLSVVCGARVVQTGRHRQRLGDAPRTRSHLMRDLIVGPEEAANATILDALPDELTGHRLSRIAKMLGAPAQL